MKRIVFGMVCFFSMVSFAFGYDATLNFKQQYSSLVSGWFVKAGPTKGGPYPNIQDCGKPAVKPDGTFDCKVTGYTANPVYAVVVPYDGAKTELVPSAEVTASVSIPAPSDVKIVIVITTVASVNRYGLIVSSTTVKKESVPLDKVVKEGTTSYRTRDGKYVTNTVIVSG
jgi:hypothetical protein